MSLQTASPTRSTPSVDPLVERLEHVVHARTNGMVRDLQISVLEGEVILYGKVRTYYTKQLATHAVFTAVQGISLTNNINVE